MALRKQDPFEDIKSREEEQETELKSVNKLTPEEREELEGKIRSYDLKVYDEDIDGSATTATWLDIIKTALVRSPDFQSIVIDEYMCPKTYDMPQFIVNPKLLLGIWLPGFYTVYKTFKDGYEQCLKELCASAILAAQKEIEDILIRDGGATMMDLHNGGRDLNIDLRDQTALQDTDLSINVLYRLAIHEKKESVGRTAVRDGLARLQGFFDHIKHSEDLFRRYNSISDQKAAGPMSIVERLAVEGMRLLSERFPKAKPSLTPLQSPKTYQIPSAISDPDVKTVDHGREDLAGAGVEVMNDDEHAAEVEAYAAEEPVFDPLPEQYVIHKAVRQANLLPVYYYPGWKASNEPAVKIVPETGDLLGDEEGYAAAPRTAFSTIRPKGPGSSGRVRGQKKREVEEVAAAAAAAAEVEADVEDLTTVTEAVEATDETRALGELLGKNMSVPRVAKRSASYNQRLVLSQKAESRIEEDFPDLEATFIAAFKYLNNEHQHVISKEAWTADMAAFGTVSSRPYRASRARTEDGRLRMPGGLIMADNWYHVRSFLHTITQIEPRIAQLISVLEQNLVKLLAMIRRGAADPLPWILILEGLIRLAWKDICQTIMESPSKLLKNFFNEFKLFVNGTAYNALWTRMQYRNPINGQNLGPWYKLIHEYDPTCALPDCGRLLPEAPEPWPVSIREIFSVGVADGRVGRHDLRMHISHNRNFAYVCTYNFIDRFIPKDGFVPVIFWYTEFYHNKACKHARGKSLSQAF